MSHPVREMPRLRGAKPDLSTWLTKAEACQRLEISERTLERWIDEEKLQATTRPQPGKRAAVVIHPGDVDRIVAEKGRPFVLPTATGDAPTGQLVALDVETLLKLVKATVQETLAGILSDQQQQRLHEPEPVRLLAPPEPEPFLTLEQVAAEWPLLNVRTLRRHIRAGKLPVLRRNPTVVSRVAIVGLMGS